MKINDSKLYGRVIFGYIIVFFIIACISLIFIYQKIKLEDINNKQYQINLVHNKIFVLPLYVNKLSSSNQRDGSFGLLWFAMIYVSHNRRGYKLRHNVGTCLRHVSMQTVMY